jgi:hypothetical protein
MMSREDLMVSGFCLKKVLRGMEGLTLRQLLVAGRISISLASNSFETFGSSR